MVGGALGLLFLRLLFKELFGDTLRFGLDEISTLYKSTGVIDLSKDFANYFAPLS